MKDKYASLAALQAVHRENSDYRIVTQDRRSWATILSPHGGYIEPGSSAIARAVSARNYNYFDFQGLRLEDAMDLHVTSTRFREPLLCKLLSQSSVALAIHSMGKANEPVVWLGGLNRTLKAIVLHNLLASGFAVNPDSHRYRGESPKNVVNLTADLGVQLELSEELMQQLFVAERFSLKKQRLQTTEQFDVLVKALRLSLRQYRQGKSAAVGI